MRSNTVIGIVVGILLGLFCATLLLLLTNDWLALLVVPVIGPPILGAVIGAYLLRKCSPLSWWYLPVVIVLGILLINAPQQYVHWRLTSLANELPVYPGATLVHRHVVERCSDNSAPWVSLEYRVDAGTSTVKAYMDQEFNRTWKKDALSTENGYRSKYRSPSGNELVLLLQTRPNSFELYLEVYEFCGRR